MPSTATTNVTIGTILDLLGPPPSAASLDGDQSAFESILSEVRSPTPSAAPTTSSKSCDEPSAFRESSQHEARRGPEAPAHDDSDDLSTEMDQTDSSPTEPNTKDGAVESDRTESADSAEPSDEELAAQELVAQSLAGLPQPTASINPAIAVVEISDSAALSDDSELQENLAITSLTTNKPAAKSTPRSQPKANGVTPANTADTNIPGDQTVPQSTADKVEKSGALESATDSKSHTSADQLGATEVSNSQASETLPESALPATSELQVEATSETSRTSFGDSGADERQDGTHQDEATTTDQEAAAKPSQVTDPTVASANALDPTAIAVPPVAAATPNQSPNSQPASANSSPAVAGVSASPRLPAQVLASAGDTAKTRGPVEIDTARLMTRVARAFSAAQDRDGEVRLRLSPAELGSLQLEIRVENGALTAKLHTETDAARTAIIENLPALREKLAEQGIRIERFDVDLMQRQPGGMSDQSGGRQPESAETQPRFAPSPLTSVSNPSAPSVIAPTPVGTTGGLNVIV